MAVAHDAVATVLQTTDPSWTHTPAGTPAGVIVLVIQDGGTEETVSCTYGGTAMTALTPVDGSGVSEPGWIYPFFLGASVPTGAQTVAVTGSGAQDMGAASYTVTAGGDVEVDDENTLISSSVDDPSVNLTATDTVMTYGALRHGLGNSSNVTADANHTKDLSQSTGGESANTEHRTAVAEAGTVAVGFVTTSADDTILYAIAVKETPGGTNVTVNAVVGILNLVGNAPAISGTGNVTAVPGVLSLVGNAPAVSGTGNIMAVPGILNLVAPAPGVSTGINATVLAVVGILRLVGNAPTLLAESAATSVFNPLLLILRLRRRETELQAYCRCWELGYRPRGRPVTTMDGKREYWCERCHLYRLRRN